MIQLLVGRIYYFDISSIQKKEKMDLDWFHPVTWNPQKDEIELLTYGVNEHQFTHCLKIMRLHSQSVGWVINASNYHEFSEEQWLGTATSYALQFGVAKGENLSENFISLSVLEDTNQTM